MSRLFDGIQYSFAETGVNTVQRFTPAPVPLPPNSCQYHSACAGLYGNCCPDDAGNFLGCCAEVHAANKLLFKAKYIDVEDIKFSDAIRPRTMQKIKTCKNCKTTFN